MKDRIMQIMQHEGLSNADFAEKIGISTSSLSHIFTGRNKASLEVVKGIHRACPYVNLNWLLYGEGEMMGKLQDATQASITRDLFTQVPETRMKGNTSGTTLKEDKKMPQAVTDAKEQIKYVQTPPPKITEIRIFFDNGTYEVFTPGNK